MELFFESRQEITKIEGKLYFSQAEPEVLPEPIMHADGRADGKYVTVQTVLRDSGCYRMWYDAHPEGPFKHMLSYAESDDGLTWKKPDLNLIKDVAYPNNYCDLGLGSPSVFIDPDAPPEARYRATGGLRPTRGWANPQGTTPAYYTAHSVDGLHWELDSSKPRWFSGDVINSIYHPGQRRGLAAMKFVRRMNGIARRAIWTADCRQGQWSDEVCALMPDEYDDVAAQARGCVSGDYYGMSMLPAGSGTVGLLWNFWHRLPLTSSSVENYALFGTADIGLVYQSGEQGRWLHVPGRKAFIDSGTFPWNRGWVHGAAGVVDVGSEQWYYLNGMQQDHGWALDLDWKPIEKWSKMADDQRSIGLAKWPAWRLFGFQADPEGLLDYELGRLDRPSRLVLNYKASFQGNVRVQLFGREIRGDCIEIPGFSAMEDSVPLTGDSVGEVVRWKSGDVIQPSPDRRLVARFIVENAAIYAWEWQPV